MAVAEVRDFLRMMPAVKQSPQGNVWLSYDREADVLYVNFKKPSYATDSEMTDDDVVIRWEGDTVSD